MFDLLPNTFISYIFEFLNLQDFPSISRTCTRFFRIINDHKKFWTRECLTHYLSFELEAYSELYDFQDYKYHIQLKALTSQKFSYKQLLADGFKYKDDFAYVLSDIGSQDQVQAFLMSFFETLKQPLLPLANLKRETILCNAQTIYQNKLSEVLYEDSGMVVKKLSFPSENEDFINGIKSFEEEILKEFSTCNRDSLAKARWYTFESKTSKPVDLSDIDEELNMLEDLPSFGRSQSLGFGLQEMQSINKPGWLLDFYNCLCHTIIHFCGIVSHHLNSIDSTYDLLAEYTLRWNTYVSTMLELEQTFKAFTEIMNKTYENVFQGHPCYPKFSIWRLMTKIWLREVYEKSNLNFSLNESFLRILSNHREKNVQKALNVNFCNHGSRESGEELPKFLYVSLKTKDKKKSILQYQNAQQLQNFRPNCLDHFEEAEKKILSAFLQSILDVSLTEVNIHYLDCTEMNVNYPYRETEEAFLLKSNEFYSEYQPLFAESPDYFYQFLKSDCALISEILPQRSFIKLETVQIQNGFQSNKEFVRNQLNKLDKDQLEKCEKESIIPNDQVNEIIDFIHNVITEVLEESTSIPEESKCNNFYSLPPIEFEIEEEESTEVCVEKEEKKEETFWCQYPDKQALARKLTKFFEIHYMNFKGNFEYLQQRLQEFEQIKEKDKYIKEVNTEKNIPFEMGDVDKLFYDLDKNIEISLLQKLSEDYNNFCNEKVKDESNGLDLPPLEQVMGPGPNGNQFGDMGFDPNMLDFDNLDLLNLENPSLRRAPI